MELNSKLTSLEEEVAILKGEIKAILQEIRTSVLARDNPFAPAPPPQDTAAPRLALVKEADDEAAPPPSTTTTKTPETPAKDAIQEQSPARSQRMEEDEPRSAQPLHLPERAVEWDVRTMAALVSWVQDTCQRFDSARLGVLLGLARYGGLIDADLEQTLLRVGAQIPMPAKAPEPSISDTLLALTTLEATLGRSSGAVSRRRAG